jgi:chitin disaccharide deacetylase
MISFRRFRARAAAANLLIVLLALTGASARADEPTYAERLGWPEGSRVVIFHSDDLGMSHEMNAGAIDAMVNGVVTSSSVMMPCPWVPEIVRWHAEHPEYDLGLHLTLTSEWKDYRWEPLLGADTVPGLVDPEGAFWPTVADVVANASADEVEAEIRAQIERARRMGFNFTHLDSHMGTLFANLGFFQRYVKVGVEYGVPVLMPGGHGTHAAAEAPGMESMMRLMGRVVWEAGLPVIDDLHGRSYNWTTGEANIEGFSSLLRELKPGITEVIVHCAIRSDNFPRITDSYPQRDGNRIGLTSEEVKRVIEEEDIILTDWRELMARRRAIAEVQAEASP